MQTTTAHGRALITAREGCRLLAYRDSVGVLTIGVGHTGRASPPAVTEGLKITMAQADQMLANDLVTFERAISEAVDAPLLPHEFDACASLAFNIGSGAFRMSSVARYLNKGDRATAANAFLLWNKAGGHALPGLTTRREDERRQFLTPYPVVPEVIASPSAPSIPTPGPIAFPPAPPPTWWSRFASLFGRKAA